MKKSLVVLLLLASCDAPSNQPSATRLQATEIDMSTPSGSTLLGSIKGPTGDQIGSLVITKKGDDKATMEIFADQAHSITTFVGEHGTHSGDEITLVSTCGKVECAGTTMWKQGLNVPTQAEDSGIYTQALITQPGILRPVGPNPSGGGFYGPAGSCTLNESACVAVCEETFWLNPLAETVCLAGCYTEYLIWLK